MCFFFLKNFGVGEEEKMPVNEIYLRFKWIQIGTASSDNILELYRHADIISVGILKIN